MDTMRSVLTVAILCATLCVAMLSGCISERAGGGEDPVKKGDAVPPFTVVSSDETGSREFSQADFVGKRSMIVFFWTPCRDCRREMPVIHEAWTALRHMDDFLFVAVSREESAEAVAAYWDSEGFSPMPWWLDPDASAFHTFADSYVPRIYLVDSRGKVAMVSVETFGFSAAELVRAIENLP